MGLWARYKKNPLPLGAFCVIATFILAAIACAFASQIRFLASGSVTNPSSPFDPPQEHMARNTALLTAGNALLTRTIQRKLIPYSTGVAMMRDDPVPANGTQQSGGKAEVRWGFFQVCVSSDSHESMVVNGEWKDTQSLAFSGCMIIHPSCVVDATSLVDQILVELGFNQTQIDQARAQDPEDWAMLENIHVVDDCGQFNAARGFAALTAIAGGVNILFFVLLWRRKIPLVALTISAVLTFLFGLIALSLIIAIEQNDAWFNMIRQLIEMNTSPVSLTLTFGLAFAMLVLGVFFSILGAVSISMELWNRTQGGHLSPFSLQSNPESGILESHVSMYQQM